MNNLKFITKIWFLLLFLISGFVSFGQNDQRKGEMKEKLKAQKVAYITSELELTEAESQKFWPIFNSYQSEIESLRQSTDKKSVRSMTDKEAEDYLMVKLEMKSKELEIQKRYVQKLKSAIPTKKIALLFGLDKEFKEKVISNIKERRNQRRG